MSKLKPCPFCGNKNISLVVKNAAAHFYGLASDSEVSFMVVCSKKDSGCSASSAWCNTEQEAVNRWNRRC